MSIDDLRDINKNLEALMELSGDLISIVDNKGFFLNANKAYRNTMGINKEELLENTIFNLRKEGTFDSSASEQDLNKKEKVIITQTTDQGKKLIVQSFPIFNKKKEITRIINVAKDITEKENLQQKLSDSEYLIAHYRSELAKKSNTETLVKTKSMEKIYDLIYRVADIDATILILGESGVGKGVVAKDIHQLGRRSNNPFIKVNCGAIPENLIESELFGYATGAFTGASSKGKPGFISAANNGTLFLDEIGELPLNAQVKLLQVIQDKQVTPLGQSQPVNVNVRFIAATNQDLELMVKEGKFRKDLFYRLNVIPIKIPPLRERREEIHHFINFFLKEFNNKYHLNKEIDYSLINLLIDLRWEGNIRELQNTIERLVVTSSDDLITANQFTESFESTITEYENIDQNLSLKEQILNYEKEILKKTLKKCYTMKEASKILNTDISTISRKIKFHKINFK